MEGAVYLVIPFVDGQVLRDHICTATTGWTDELEALRPADAIFHASVPMTEVAFPIQAILVGVAIAAVLVVSLLAFRHRPR